MWMRWTKYWRSSIKSTSDPTASKPKKNQSNSSHCASAPMGVIPKPQLPKIKRGDDTTTNALKETRPVYFAETDMDA